MDFLVTTDRASSPADSMIHVDASKQLQIDWDVPIGMSDGNILRADVFRPLGTKRSPVILSYGPYAKGKSFQASRPYAWKHLTEGHPDVLRRSTNQYQSWEVVDPEIWVPDGYAIVRVDSRGMGRSPGYVDPYSHRETEDLKACIEWAGVQAWSNGRVGLCGISYYAVNAWHVAATQPEHLKAICAWEGAGDHYRDQVYHGGIYSQGRDHWFPRAILPVQHGVGERGARNELTGELVAGPETLSDHELARNRADIIVENLAHPLCDSYHRERSAQWDKIEVPFLSAGNWGGQGNHLRGNVDAFVHAASSQKWLEIHGDTHWTEFYTAYGIDLQKRFLSHFLKGDDTGWSQQPPVQLKIRHPSEEFTVRHEQAWPIPRTQWTKYYLSPDTMTLDASPPEDDVGLDYTPLGDGLTFFSQPLSTELEITGPMAAKLFVSSTAEDTDLFLIFRVFRPDGSEVVFQGQQDPHTPVAQGWLRASHRKLDGARSKPYQPYHTHDEVWPLKPNEAVELDVEIWPTCIVVPVGYRFALTVRGSDYRYDGPPVQIPGLPYPMTGVGGFRHERAEDRPPAVYHATSRLHFSATRQPYVLLPIIPPG
jgi:predicted acyl esterase